MLPFVGATVRWKLPSMCRELPDLSHWSLFDAKIADGALGTAAQMLAKRQAMGDQEPPAQAAKRKRAADSDDDDDDNSDEGGRRGGTQTSGDGRRRRAAPRPLPSSRPSRCPVLGCALCCALLQHRQHASDDSYNRMIVA